MPGLLVLAGWSVDCQAPSCLAHYEALVPTDLKPGQVPREPYCCSLCRGPVKVTPFYGERR